MDNKGKKLELGKYYYIDSSNIIVKYIGSSHKIEDLYLFEWKNFLDKKILIRRRFDENNPFPIYLDKYNTEYNSDYDTDSEFLEDTY
jgi:hypothetical protein